MDNPLAQHVFDTGVALNKAMQAFHADDLTVQRIYIITGVAALGYFSTRAKAEAVAARLDFPTTITEETVY